MPETRPAPAPPRTLDPREACAQFDLVYRAALRMTRSAHAAEDLTQETYVKVLSRPRYVRGDDDIGYLLRALRNTHVSACRQAAARPCCTPGPETLERVPRRGGDPHAAAELAELVAGIAELPAGQRDVVAAVALQGLTYAETAAALQVPEGTIMSRLHRARAALTASHRAPTVALAA